MTTPAAPSDAFAKVIARAWADDGYKQRLTDDTRATLAEAGIQVPEGVEIRAVENTATVSHFVIPTQPTEGEVSEDALATVSGGTCMSPGSVCSGCYSS